MVSHKNKPGICLITQGQYMERIFLRLELEALVPKWSYKHSKLSQSRGSLEGQEYSAVQKGMSG